MAVPPAGRRSRASQLAAWRSGRTAAIYFSQTSAAPRCVRRISPIAEQFVDGRAGRPGPGRRRGLPLHPGGRHLRTLDALTGTLRYQFAYDAAGRLTSITDGDGNVTTIERDGEGRPTAIVGPYGQVTALEVDGDGFLSRVTNPAGEAIELSHDAGGLLTRVIRPGGRTSSYHYDALGRLTAATDPTGATKTLARDGTDQDLTVTLTSPLGRTSTYRSERTGNGDMQLDDRPMPPAGGRAR